MIFQSILDNSSSRKRKKLKEAVDAYGFKITVPKDLDKLKELYKKYYEEKQKIVSESVFNSYHNNSKYNFLTLVLETIECEIRKRTNNETTSK